MLRHFFTNLCGWIVSGISGRLLVFTTLLCILILICNYILSSIICHVSGPRHWTSSNGYRNFAIRTTWDGSCVQHEPIKITLGPASNGDCTMQVMGPFFDSPGAPKGQPGEPFDQLWDYEVVEAFFLNDKNQYLEVELCPHGQHLLLMLNGRKKAVQTRLALTYKVNIEGGRWEGETIIPRSYFPPNVTRFNAYAIHGEGRQRTYEALYPAVGDFEEPDFHRLEFFQPLDMSKILKNYQPSDVSTLWQPFVEKS